MDLFAAIRRHIDIRDEVGRFLLVNRGRNRRCEFANDLPVAFDPNPGLRSTRLNRQRQIAPRDVQIARQLDKSATFIAEGNLVDVDMSPTAGRFVDDAEKGLFPFQISNVPRAPI